jgi:ankyrin repeat protein
VDRREGWRGQTALMWAAAEGHAAAVEELVRAKADMNLRSNAGFTPFLFAVREGRLEAVKTLLRSGADVNQALQATGQMAGRRRAAGMSALALAASNAHFELAAHLLDAGADPNANVPGWTALHSVTWVRKPGLGDNDPAPQGSGAMTSLQFVRKLAAKGADLNSRMTRRVNVGLTALNTNGATTYVLAARTGDAELMRLLAELGADVKIPTADGATAMIVAAGLGTRSPGEDAGSEEEVVEALQAALDHGLDINAVDNNGETAMHGAAYKNLPGAVRFLASHGAKIEVWNRKNKLGLKPLWIAEGYRPGNFKPNLETAAEVRKLMVAVGASIELEPGVAGVIR